MQRAAALVLLVLMAGCTSAPDAPAAPDDAMAPVVFAEDYALGNETVPREELQNATLGAEHTHDAWGGAEQLVLLDDALTAGDCEGAQDALFYALVTTFAAEGPSYGCARISLPEGAVVPEGAGELRIEVDATDALKSGGMQFQFRNKAREEALEATSEKQHAWSVPLTEADWDIAHVTATTFVMYVGAVGPGAVFEGTVQTRVVAVKQEGWEPVLAVAHVDHWMLPSMHDFAAPGVMRLFDGEASVTNVDPSRATSQEKHHGIPLADIVAPGATQLVLVVDTTATDCAPGLTCWLVPILHVGGYERDRFGTLLAEEGARRVYGWRVPDEVPEDSVYAETSTTGIEPRIDACTPDGTCGAASIASGSAAARIQAFAWKGEVDLALLDSLAGAPA